LISSERNSDTMKNAIKQPQTILLLGGGSDIGQAIVQRLASPALRTVILAGRTMPLELTTPLRSGTEVVSVVFDAIDHAAHGAFVQSLAERYGDLDIVIQAFGQLGGADVGDDPVSAAELAQVNYVGAVSSGLAVANQLRRQGHGTLVVLTSVAGVRTRASNFVYGSTKAAQDAFATGLGHSLHGSGADVLVVRPGHVRTKMSAGVDEAPFACEAGDVATAVVKGLQRGSSVVWAPPVLRGVFGVLRYAPDPLWRRLDR
jgi:decaprenylphospho-beta-D-erythro-pentofuranosid-2-ulose 2-reductase